MPPPRQRRAAAAAPRRSRGSAEEKAQPNLVGYGAAPRGAARPQRRAALGGAASGRASDTAVLEAAPHDVIHVAEVVRRADRASALDAARPHARQAAGRRPRARRGDRRVRPHHARRRRGLRGARGCGIRHRSPRSTRAVRAPQTPGRAHDAHADPRRAQAHRRGDGAQRLHRAARHDVPHRRHHRDDRAHRVAEGRSRAAGAQDRHHGGRGQGRVPRARAPPRPQLAVG